MDFLIGRERRFKGEGGGQGSRGALLLVSPAEMDQEYERRLLRQINHQNLPREARLSKVRPTGGRRVTLTVVKSAVKLGMNKLCLSTQLGVLEMLPCEPSACTNIFLSLSDRLSVEVLPAVPSL